MEKNYIYLWFFDVFFAIPIILLIFFPDKTRRIILISLLIIALIFFFFEFGFNSVYFNTFLALFLANRFLLFNLNPEDKTTFARSKSIRFFLSFAVAMVVTVTESILDNIGILHHEKVGDGSLMSTAGKIFLFVGYYGIVAYLEYRKVKYPNSKYL